MDTAFLAHLSKAQVRFCGGDASVVHRLSCVVLRQQFQTTSPPKLPEGFQPNFTEMFLGWFYTKFVQIMTPGLKMAQPGGLSVFNKKS